MGREGLNTRSGGEGLQKVEKEGRGLESEGVLNVE